MTPAFVTPQDYYDPSIEFRSPPLGLDWMGAGDNKKSLRRSSIRGVCLTSLLKVGLNSLSKVGLTHPTPVGGKNHELGKYVSEHGNLATLKILTKLFFIVG